MVLSNPVNAAIADGTGVVTILDNDGALTASSVAPSPAAAGASLSSAQISASLDGARSIWAGAGFDTSGLDAIAIDLLGLPGATLAEADGATIRSTSTRPAGAGPRPAAGSS